MAAYINTNISSLNAQRNLTSSQGALSTSLQRLSSGLRINSAKDDAAGLAISERMSAQIRGMNQAVRNANDGISLAQTAEGALGEIGNNLQRIRELAVQARNASNSDVDRAALQKEVSQLLQEINRVASDTEFNGIKLLDGNFNMQSFQVGANQGQTIDIDQIVNANISALGTWTSVGSDAVATGVAPVGAGGTPAVPGTATIAVGDLVAPTDGDGFNYDAFDIEVNGQPVTVAATGTATSAAEGRAMVLANIKTAIDAQNISGLSVEVDTGTGTLTFTNTGSAPVEITDTDSVLGDDITVDAQDPAVPGTFNALTGGNFTVNGVEIEVGAAASATDRLNDLVTEINANVEGVTATIVNGALQLTSASNIEIDGDANVLEQTGLTADTAEAVVGSEQVGFANLKVTSVTDADNAILAMDAALDAINSARADLGAIQNRFTSVVSNLSTTVENLSASRSRIQDTDFAAETAQLTRAQILQQAGTAMLAQANSLPNNVLTLLRG